MRSNQMAKMADECREHTTGFNQVRMICAKTDGHVTEGDLFHHDPFHNVTWREIDAARVPAYSAAATGDFDDSPTVPTQHTQFDDKIELPVLERRTLPLRSGVVYIRPIKARPTLAHWLKAAVWA